jgi:hypothetical protein
MNTRKSTHTSHPYAHIKTYNYRQLEDGVLSEGSVYNGHVVLTIVAPRGDTTKFIGACPGETPEL